MTPRRGVAATATGRGVAAFLAISFGLAWLPFLPVLFGGTPVGAVLMPVAPAIACVVVRRWVTREGFADAGLRVRMRHRWRYAVVALLWPVAATIVAVSLAFVLEVGPAGLALPWGLARPAPLTMLTWVPASVALAPLILGEELGWRGYLQIRILPGRPVLAAVATGLIWGVWHYPWILATAEPGAEVARDLTLLTTATTVTSVFLGWLRARSGNVWVPSLAHAANNGTQFNLTRLSFTGTADGALPAGVSAAILLGEAIVMLGVVAADRIHRRWPSPRRASLRPGTGDAGRAAAAETVT